MERRSDVEVTRLVADILREYKAEFAGVARLSQAFDFIRQQGGSYIAEFPTVISIGIAMPNAIVDLLPTREKAARLSYGHHAYELINQRLDLAASEVSSVLQENGYRAFPIPASQRIDKDKLCAVFSHKLGANLSGLGWIGKNCLLITPEHGPRVRWASVLSDAPLQATGKKLEEQCGDCTRCVEICPAQAFTGRHFSPEEPREARFNANKCENYFNEIKAKGEVEVCGLCLYVCPFGLHRR
jgi:epoxyqueuosine reductase